MINPALPSLDAIRPALAKLAEHGGVILIALKHDPKSMNYSDVSWGHFYPPELKAFRRALSNARKKRLGSKP